MANEDTIIDGPASDNPVTLESALAQAKGAEHKWATSNGRYWAPTPTTQTIPAGVYSVGVSQRIGPYLDRATVVKDNLIILPDMGAEVILDEITQFLDKKDRYRARGMVHKRGILMEGPPGSGKTSNSELLIELFISKVGGIVFVGQNVGEIAVGLQLIRAQEPDRPIMVVLEDIDGMVRGGAEEHLLNLLDGKHQFDGVVTVATTNYLEHLPDRIANRPSRFDLVVKIGLPSPAAREAYLQAVEPTMKPERRQQIVDQTAEYSVAHLKELLLLTEVYEMPLENALGRINGIMKKNLMPEQASLRTVKSTPFAIHAKAEDA